jgi:hypothetical protein
VAKRHARLLQGSVNDEFAGLQRSMRRGALAAPTVRTLLLVEVVKTTHPGRDAGALRLVGNERPVETPPDVPEGPPVEEPPPSDPDAPGGPAGDPAPNEPGKWALNPSPRDQFAH